MGLKEDCHAPSDGLHRNKSLFILCCKLGQMLLAKLMVLCSPHICRSISIDCCEMCGHSELFTQNASLEIALGDETQLERAAGGPGASRVIVGSCAWHR